jgi:hypothetical protein
VRHAELTPQCAQAVCFAAIVAALSLAACSRSPSPNTLTVDYYRAHPTEREAELARCGNDPGGIGDSAACINAREATRIEGVGSLRSLPPMGLPTRPAAPASSGKP